MNRENVPIRRWCPGVLPGDVEQALQRLRNADDVVAVAVMPDVHLAGDICIGTVVATTRLIYPPAVGGDIGCGMAALRFAGPASALQSRRQAQRILAGLDELVPILRHRRPQQAPAELFAQPLSDPALDAHRGREALEQLGTLGRGNHFAELQSDESGDLWLMVHSGSRSLGPRIRDHHLRNATASRVGIPFLDAETPAGKAYLADLRWALAYAEENRRRIVEAAAEVISVVTGFDPDPESVIICNHNHVERAPGPDTPDGSGAAPLWIHRKGAISARGGQPGIIPGSMGQPSFHVEGRGLPEALWSSSHGAGRTMSRSQARARIRVDDFERQVEGIWFDPRLTSRLIDEAPAAYKDIGEVMRAQRPLTRIVRRLTPVLSYKGV